MNLSEWREYTLEKRQKLLAEVASTVKNGEMPLAQYRLIHRQARLSDAERNQCTSGFVASAEGLEQNRSRSQPETMR
jgi:Haem-binding domain